MGKNKLSIIFALITIICIFSVAAIADQCGCRAFLTEESKDNQEAGVADDKKEEEPKEEPPEEETPPEDELPEEEPAEEEQPDEGEPAEAPTLTLEIIEGPTYSPSDGVCYYRIKANVSENPTPDVEFSKDDSNGAWGDYIAQVNLEDPSDTYKLTVTATNSEGAATDSMNIIWGCATENSPPVISEITFMGDHYTGLEYTFSAAVSDPDGDSVSYSWSVNGGSLADPHTNPVKWTMPNAPGNYDITVTVDDGKGGFSEKTETIAVTNPPQTQHNINLSIDEMGYIIRGSEVSSSVNQLIFIGDWDNNKTVRGFVSFDIRDLSGTTIDDATFKIIDPHVFHTPYNNLIEAFQIKVINWGNDDLSLGDYDLPSKPLGEYLDLEIIINSQDLLDYLQTAVNNDRDRFQIMISHRGWQTNNNNEMDYIYFDTVRLNAVYTSE